jgi:hypothetical protein
MSMLSRMDDRGRWRRKSARAVAAGYLGDGFGQARRGQWSGGDDRRARGGHFVDPFPHHFDIGMRRRCVTSLRGEALAVDRQRRAGRDSMLVGGAMISEPSARISW